MFTIHDVNISRYCSHSYTNILGIIHISQNQLQRISEYTLLSPLLPGFADSLRQHYIDVLKQAWLQMF
jgi:hypothetical protein